MTATETETMVTLIKTEPNIDDYEWISEASEEEYQIKERIKFEVVQENSSSSEDPSPLSSIRDEETSSNAPSSHASSASSFFPTEPFFFSAFDLDAYAGARKAFEVPSNYALSEYTKCTCCSSGLQKLPGPPKKRILLATGHVGSADGKLNADVDASAQTHVGTPVDPTAPVVPSTSAVQDVKPGTRRLARKLFSADIESEKFSPLSTSPNHVPEKSVHDKQSAAAGICWKGANVPQSSDKTEDVYYEFKCEGPESELSQWGYVRFQQFTFPFIFRNGYKLVPVPIILRLMFNPCCCTVPRSVLNARKSLTKTSASWEEIRRIETVKICRDTKITFGSQLIQVEDLLASLPMIYDEITRRHSSKKLSRKTASCPWLTYRCEVKPLNEPPMQDKNG